MDSQKLQQINLESKTLKELQDEIHPQIIDILNKSRFTPVVESSINLSENRNNDQIKNPIHIEETLSIRVIITVCWFDDDGNRHCKQVEL